MPTDRDPTRLLDTLQDVMERLSAPDLTAAESRELRPRLFQLLEAIESGQGKKGPALVLVPARRPARVGCGCS